MSGTCGANAAQRSSFNSTELTRDVKGGFSITVAAQVQPGDWLPTPSMGTSS